MSTQYYFNAKVFAIILTTVFILCGCEKNEVALVINPVFSTDKIWNPDADYVYIGADIDENQLSKLTSTTTSYGFVWSTHPGNTKENATVIELSTPLTDKYFNASIFGLKSNTHYFVRAYMEVNGEIYYANEESFATRAGKWKRLKDFPGTGTVNGASFTLQGRAYMVTGGEVWMYNPEVDEWTRKKDFPVITIGPTAFAIGESGYVYCGSLYKYNPAEDSWRVIPVPADTWKEKGCKGVTSFVVNGIAYIGGGLGNLNEGFTSFNPVDESWGSFPFSHQAPNVSYATSFAVGEIAFVIGGEELGSFPSSQILRYDFGNRTSKTSILQPDGFESERWHMLSFVIGDRAFTGYGKSRATDFYYLNHETSSFELLSTALTYAPPTTMFRPSRMGGIAFAVGNKGYIGLGRDSYEQQEVLLKDFWEFTPD